MASSELDKYSDEYLIECLERGFSASQAQAFREELLARGVTPPEERDPEATPKPGPTERRIQQLLALLALPFFFLVLGYFLPEKMGNAMGSSALILALVSFWYWATRR